MDGSSHDKQRVIRSMLILAGIIGVAVFATAAATSYFRGQDPVNRCIDNPQSQPFQFSVPLEVYENGIRSTVRGVGMDSTCTRPVHTLEDNVIHVAYEKPYNFTLGHFVYYWLGNDVLKYDVKAYVNGTAQAGDFRDILLAPGENIRIDLTTRQ